MIEQDGSRCGAQFNAPHRAIRCGEDAHPNQPIFAKLCGITRVAQIKRQPAIEFALPIIGIISAAHLKVGNAKLRLANGRQREIQLMAWPIALLAQSDRRQM